MTKKEKLELCYEILGIITNYDYSDCENYNDFISQVFGNIMLELDKIKE